MSYRHNHPDIPINGEAGINPIKLAITRITSLEEAFCLKGTNGLGADPQVIISYVRNLANGNSDIPPVYKKFIKNSELCQRLYLAYRELK